MKGNKGESTDNKAGKEGKASNRYKTKDNNG